jgi:hypothetical protein
MASLKNMCTALATTLSAVPGLRTYGFSTGQVSPPAAIVTPQPGQLITWDTLDNSVTYYLRIILLVGYGEDAGSQQALDDLLDNTGANSAIGVLHDNATLSGQVSYCVPLAATSYGVLEWAGLQYYGCTITVQAVAL